MNINKYSALLILCLSMFSCKRNTQANETATTSEVTTKNSKKIDKLPYFNTPDFTPTWLSNSPNTEDLHKIPEFSFTNQLGVKITNSSFEGKIYIASFFFTTCPSICLQMTENMRELQKMYQNDNDILFISHTVLPSIDTVEVLKAFGERQKIDPKKWHLVTGKKETIYQLAREAYFADDLFKKTQDKDRFIHTENFILIDQSGHIRGVYDGTLPVEINRIREHIEILKGEK